MEARRPDRVVGLLTSLVSVSYFGLWVVGVVILVAAPVLKGVGDGTEWTWGLLVPATVVDEEATVLTTWGPARLEVEDVRGKLRLPLAMLPWWLFALLWTHAALAGALMLAFLHHLRRVFQRARDGAPFDASNAPRLRWLGLLLLALALLNGAAGLVTSLAVRRGLTGDGITVPASLPIDGGLVFVALVLLALAEVFRRGAELEHEQSLVI